jgi:small Trp-rich protein
VGRELAFRQFFEVIYMVFVVTGLILLALKLTEWGPIALWDWWIVLAPFGVALIWWWWKDASGLTRRQEMEKDARRKEDRRLRNIAAMGLGPDPKSSSGKRRR